MVPEPAVTARSSGSLLARSAFEGGLRGQRADVEGGHQGHPDEQGVDRRRGPARSMHCVLDRELAGDPAKAP